VTTSAVAALAEDPELYVVPAEDAERIVSDRYCVVIGPQRRWAGVCRLRFSSRPSPSSLSSLSSLSSTVDDEIAATVGEIRQLTTGCSEVVWNVGSSATPPDLPERLRTYGLVDPEPPYDPVCAAMVLETEPPRVPDVVVTRVETFEQHLAGLEIMLAASAWSEAAAADQRERARDTFERRTRRGGFQWLAWVEGEPAAFAAADRAEAGLFLAGGSTRPAARGRGCYRALVRARWEESVRLGSPGLAVQSQYATSAPVLRGLGFTEVAQVHTLLDPVP
jgi:hypothetical protein